ncbi:preATP grasp domain-containing protein [Paenibacillus kyungheensis]
MRQQLSLMDALTDRRDKGRLVWIFNIGAESVWHNISKGVSDPQEQEVVNRIEEMNLLLCRKQDIMILRKQPDPDYLDMLENLGFELPRIEIPEGESDDPFVSISQLILQDEALLERLQLYGMQGRAAYEETYLVPYAVTQWEEEIARTCEIPYIGAPSDICKLVNDKIFSRQAAIELGFPVSSGTVCATVEEIRRECLAIGTADAEAQIIIKEPYGASGKGLYLLQGTQKLDATLSVMSRFARKQNNPDQAWLVERWHKKQMDLNYQIYIHPDGDVEVFSLKRQIVDGTVYIGSYMPSGVSETIRQQSRKYAMELGHYLYEKQYRGIASIDAFIDESGELIPVIEINGRFTLSTYISLLPQVFGLRIFRSRYFRHITKERLTYQALCQTLEEHDLLYTSLHPFGVWIYTAGTLSASKTTSGYNNRIFAIVIADTQKEAQRLEEQLEHIIAGL